MKTNTTQITNPSPSAIPFPLPTEFLPAAPPFSVINRSHWRAGFGLPLLALALAWFVLSPMARAVLPPPAPDGDYPGYNTAEGNAALFSLTSGQSNTAVGFNALGENTVGFANTAVGDQALLLNVTGRYNTASGANALFGNKADYNTATGYEALRNNNSGAVNTATGVWALRSNSTGGYNTATGVSALYSNTSGTNNIATGGNAMFYNITGSQNTATGFLTLQANIDGSNNTASGFKALFSNNSGGRNTASGANALFSSTSGYDNTASGFQALWANTSGSSNTATGAEALISSTASYNTGTGAGALYRDTTGTGNVAAGYTALFSNTTGSSNLAEGYQALYNNISGSSNIAVGSSAGINLTGGSNNIEIGNVGVAGDSGKIRIGKTQTATYIAGISGKSIASATAAAVFVDSTGHLGTIKSSARYKDEIKPMDQASEAILHLQPVTFRYKEELDPDGVRQFGLIAEQVEKVDPALVIRDEDGKVSTVRYEAVNAMLLNEFLKEHRKVEELNCNAQEQQAIIARFKSQIAHQQKQIEALTATVQKVSDEIELTNPAPRVVASAATTNP